LTPFRTLFFASLVAVCVVVGPRLSAPFVWDDLTTVAYNGRLAQAGLADLFSPAYFQVAQEFSYRPASTLLHWAGLKAFGTAPAGHRALELALHLLTAGLLVLALRRWGLASEAAYAAGALFAVHPLHLETLFCVAFNEEILVAALLLAAWLARMRWQEEGRAAMLAASGACFGLALFAKETAALGLPALWLFERLRPGRRPGRADSWAPYLGAAFLYIVVRFWLLRGPQEGVDFPVAPPPLMRLYFAGFALSRFAQLAVAPIGLRIEYFAVPPAGAGELLASAAGWLFAVAALSLAYRSRKAVPAVAAGAAWTLLLFLPACNLVPAYALTTRYFAERWTYLPMIGSALALGGLLEGHLASARARLLATAALTFLVVCSFQGAVPWSDERLLWSRLADAYPWSAKAHEGLGEARYRAGEYGPALESFETGMRLRLDRGDRVLEYYIPLFEARALGRPLPLRRETPAAHRWLARAWLALGRPDEARAHMLRADRLAAGL